MISRGRSAIYSVWNIKLHNVPLWLNLLKTSAGYIPPPNPCGVNIAYLSASLVAKPPTATRTRIMKTEDPTNCPKLLSSVLETIAPYILNSKSGSDVHAPTNMAPATSCLIFS